MNKKSLAYNLKNFNPFPFTLQQLLFLQIFKADLALT